MNTINLDNYDFLDFGCGSGELLDYYAIFFNARKAGLGIDKDSKKISSARRRRYDVLQCDVTKLEANGKVRFVVMSDFLEHISDLKTVTLIMWKAVSVSKEFVFIRQPYFDADPYLFKHHLKFYWSDWKGHPNRMTTLEFHNILKEILRKGTIKRFSFYGRKKVKSSSDPSIHSIRSPGNQHEWKKSEHPPKKSISFGLDIFRQLSVVIDINGKSTKMIEDHMPDMIKIYDSNVEIMKKKSLAPSGKMTPAKSINFIRIQSHILWLLRIVYYRLMRMIRVITSAGFKQR